MSQQLINLSPDLKRLRDEGFEVEIRSGYLLISHVPYVNSNKEIKYGTLISGLSLAADKTIKPDTHVTYLAGEHPCNNDGSLIPNITHSSNKQTLAEGVGVDYSFSSKPANGYPDYYEKMTTYIEIFSAPAKSLDATVTAKTFKIIQSVDPEDVFNYLDTNSSRAEIIPISDKLKGHKIGIIGLGGTGSYILDLMSKTPVREIHLFDGDSFDQHNAFRAPGAASIEKLGERSKKTEYFKSIYSAMHKGIHSHPVYITASNVCDVLAMDFVFICMDNNEIKASLIDQLDQKGISYIDVGMGLYVADDKLGGIVRVTTSTPRKRDHVKAKAIFADGVNNEYSTNIQIADLNMLNAALAVIKWKKLCGFYGDFEKENNSTYTLDGDMLLNEDTDP